MSLQMLQRDFASALTTACYGVSLCASSLTQPNLSSSGLTAPQSSYRLQCTELSLPNPCSLLSPSSTAQNLGVVLDSTLSFKPRITAITRLLFNPHSFL